MVFIGRNHRRLHDSKCVARYDLFFLLILFHAPQNTPINLFRKHVDLVIVSQYLLISLEMQVLRLNLFKILLTHNFLLFFFWWCQTFKMTLFWCLILANLNKTCSLWVSLGESRRNRHRVVFELRKGLICALILLTYDRRAIWLRIVWIYVWWVEEVFSQISISQLRSRRLG